MRIVIIGGGPGGLYLSALLKQADPHRDVILFERNRADDPYGFGVVFSDHTMSSLAEGDPGITAELASMGPSWDAIEVRLHGQSIRCGGIGFTAIARATLLGMLQDKARDAGVDLRFQTPLNDPDDLPDHDLLVAADGANSTVRGWYGDAFGHHTDVGDAKFIWLGTTKPFDCLTFAFEHDDHGAYGVHAYPFEDGTSTFLVETDPDTWRAAGLDGFDPARHPPGESDQHSVDYLATLFADQLDGHDLLASNSRWHSFPTVHNQRWSHGRTVLIGDAAHTAHFSVGSGTRMAMEDALALNEALAATAGVEDALTDYEAVRRPAVEHIQAAAEPSLRWWERFGSHTGWGTERFAYHFLTRTPRITRGSLGRLDPSFVAAVDAAMARTPTAPLIPNSRRGATDTPPPRTDTLALTAGPDGHIDEDAALAEARELIDAGATRLVLRLAEGTPEAAAGRWRWRQLLISERIRKELRTPTVVVLPDADPNLARTVVETGRADAVVDRLARRYRDKGYWTGDTLGDLLAGWAARSPDATALVHGQDRLSYAELDQTVDRVACGMVQQGFTAGDKVVLHLPNCLEFVVAAFAMMRIGVVPVFALPDHREQELAHFLSTADAVGYVVPTVHRGFDVQAVAHQLRATHPRLAHVIVVAQAAGDPVDDAFTPFTALTAHDLDADHARQALRPYRPDPGDTAFFLLSGGTTGLPKLIPRTHDDYAYNVRASAELCGMDADTVYLVTLPVAHNFPWGCPGLLGTLATGGRAVLTQNPHPSAAFPLIAAEGVTMTALVPALAIRWMDAAADTDQDLSSLELVQVGGARLNPEAARKIRPTLGADLQQVFGMAEGLLNYTRLDDPEEVVVTTQGRPLSPDDEIRIVDADSTPVPDGQAGRLQTRGPYTIRAYHNAPAANADSFTPDGFYRSGDVVRLHPSGNLTVEGRVKDFINRGGEKFSAEEVEDHILAYPAVANVAVVAMPDREMNERSCAYVVPRPDQQLDKEVLATFLAGRGLARFKIPDRLEIIDALPQTTVGKVDKVTLRDDIAKKLADEGAV